jgi:hypothetical protein
VAGSAALENITGKFFFIARRFNRSAGQKKLLSATEAVLTAIAKDMREGTARNRRH